MKLILCTHCQDIIKISTFEQRFCKCKRCWGMTIDDDNVKVSGNEFTVVLGINNRILRSRVIQYLNDDKGRDIMAFVIGKDCKTVTREGV